MRAFFINLLLFLVLFFLTTPAYVVNLVNTLQFTNKIEEMVSSLFIRFMNGIYTDVNLFTESSDLSVPSYFNFMDCCCLAASFSIIFRPMVIPLDKIRTKSFNHEKNIHVFTIYGSYPTISWVNQCSSFRRMDLALEK